MRTIKFRAWDTKNKKWIDDFLIQDDGSVCRYGMFETLDSINNVVLMQFTGLHDKNGKEIWEGDILEHNNSLYPKGFKGWASKSVVRWNSKTASFDMGRYGEEEAGGSILTEVIGNIYENPELLNGDKNE